MQTGNAGGAGPVIGVALYSDNAGVPGTMLAYTAISTDPGTIWNWKKY